MLLLGEWCNKSCWLSYCRTVWLKNAEILATDLKIQFHPTPGEGAVQELTSTANPHDFPEHPMPNLHAKFPFIFLICTGNTDTRQKRAVYHPQHLHQGTDKLQQMRVCPKRAHAGMELQELSSQCLKLVISSKLQVFSGFSLKVKQI